MKSHILEIVLAICFVAAATMYGVTSIHANRLEREVTALKNAEAERPANSARAYAEQAAEDLREQYLSAAPAIQRAIDVGSTNGVALHVSTDVDTAITEARFGNPTNALVAIHNAQMELDDIIVLWKPITSASSDGQ